MYALVCLYAKLRATYTLRTDANSEQYLLSLIFPLLSYIERILILQYKNTTKRGPYIPLENI